MKLTAGVFMNLDKIIKMFSTKDFPEQLTMSVIKRLAKDKGIPSDKLSISNQLLMRMQGATDIRTAKAWAKVGRTVKSFANDKKVWIICPTMIWVDQLQENNTYEKKQILIGYHPEYRWDVSNTDGAPLETVDYTPPVMPPLMEVAEKWNIKTTYIPHTGQGYYGYTNTKNEIVLCTTETRTFFHELAHQAHRRVEENGWLDKEKAEIVAETVSAVLCQMYGITGFERYSFDYVAHFAKGEKNLYQKVGGLLNIIEKTLLLIVENADSIPTETEEENNEEVVTENEE